MLNVMVGGSYIVFAKVGDFPEWLSLLHLVVGVGAFIAAVVLMFATRFARSTQHTALPRVSRNESDDRASSVPHPGTLTVMMQLMKLRVIVLLQITALCNSGPRQPRTPRALGR